jgi:GDP-L-fucose synthase
VKREAKVEHSYFFVPTSLVGTTNLAITPVTILVTGGTGMLARNIRDAWEAQGHQEELVCSTRADADLTDAAAVTSLFTKVKPRLIIHAAARVAGFLERRRFPLDFLGVNIAIDRNVVAAALATKVGEMAYLGSALAYPPMAPGERSAEGQFLQSGFPTLMSNYGLAKAVGMRLVESAVAQHGVAYRVIVPTNLYGPHDHYSLSSGHVIPSAFMKAGRSLEAGKPVVILGDGSDQRQFTYTPDLAAWLTRMSGDIETLPTILNVGADVVTTIREVYELASRIVGCESGIVNDLSFTSSSTPQLIDSTRAGDHLWMPGTSLSAGMALSYDWYLEHVA